MNTLRHRAIAASAGTGKTFRLAHRYLGLLSSGVAPDRICALTFSRKAAGEIFDKIVDRLCLGAASAARRAETARVITAEGLTAPPDDPRAYVGLLRHLLDQQHRLHIGTLDSFIVGVVRAFPLELGLPPDLQPMDDEGGEAGSRRQAILARLFDPTRWTGQEDDRQGGGFLDDFRLACFGRENKALARVLEETLSNHFGFYHTHAGPEWHWGDAGSIWPGAARWWDLAAGGERSLADAAGGRVSTDADASTSRPRRTGGRVSTDADASTSHSGIDSTTTRSSVREGRRPLSPEAVEAATAALQEALAKAFGGGRGDAVAAQCAALYRLCLTHAPDRPWPRPDSVIARQLVAAAAKPEAPVVTFYRKSHAIPADVWARLRQGLARLIAIEIDRALSSTRGLRAVLERYDRLYSDAASQDGCYTFDDLARLLGPAGRTPGRNPHDAERLYIDYRLDARLDHWLLDEFQDTSDTQWAALANLVDEAVQGDERSFFYVGDIKQSIYGWRGGNHRLFRQVLDEYRDLGDRGILLESMTDCHRSLPAVIEAVNAVFDDLPSWIPALGADKGLRPEAVADFDQAWKPHRSARTGAGDGFAALLQYPADATAQTTDGDDGDDDDTPSMPAVFEAVAAVLQEAWSPTLTTAVLVRSNKQGRECADVLRRRLPGVPVVHEGKGGILDSPVVTALLALIRYAAHPGDLLALRHLQMSPLASTPELSDPESLPRRVLMALHEDGYAATLRAWGDRLGDLDDFGRQRRRELLAAAEQFDATGQRHPDAFADYVEAFQVSTLPQAGAVRVMTIHQSKGLGFGMVVVPLSPSSRGSFAKPGDPDLLADPDGGWVLQPPSTAPREAAGGSPLEVLEAYRAEANFSQLCVLYVALTRAERALYMLIPEAKANASAVREADLLRERLAALGAPSAEAIAASPAGLTCLAAVGDPNWHRAVAPPADGAAGAPRRLPALRLDAEDTLARHEPSKEQAETQTLPAPWLFTAESGDVRAFGSALHRLFERIEWIEDADVEALIAAWRQESPETPALLDDVEAQCRACLRNPSVRALLRRPAGPCEVWREAPFNLRLDDRDGAQLVSGRFDRMVLERDPATGRPIRATILDYKSNRVTDDEAMRQAAAGYHGQMADYARAAARLCGLEREAVRTILLFTRLGKALAVP